MLRVILLSVSIAIGGLCQGSLGSKPTIFPQSDHVINEGEELIIRCESDKNVTFAYPNYKYARTSEVEIIQENNTLLRRQSVYGDTGWYACAERGVVIPYNDSITEHNQSDIAWTYVYVKSEDHKFIRDKGLHTITPIPGSAITLHCGTTSPDLDVHLYHAGGEIVTDDRIRYNHKVGFTWREITFRDSGFYDCVVDGMEDRYDYMNFIDVQTGRLPTPGIIGGQKQNVRRGETLSLNCAVVVKLGLRFVFKWRSHRQIEQGTRLNESCSRKNIGQAMMKYLCQLVVKNVTLTDDGEYECFIQGVKDRKYRKVYVSVLGSLRSKPTIFPQSDHVINEGEELIIRCESDKNVTFAYPNYNYAGTSEVEIIQENNTLLRRQSVSGDTGWYACAERGVVIPYNDSISEHNQSDIAWTYVYVKSGRLPTPVIIGGQKQNVRQGETLCLNCAVEAKLGQTFVFNWRTHRQIEQSTRLRIRCSRKNIGQKIMEYSCQLMLKNVTLTDDGEYECYIDGGTERKYQKVYVSVLDGIAPYFVDEESNETMEVREGELLSLNCNVEGQPRPTVIWMKDNKPMENVRGKLSNYDRSLKIKFAQPEDSGLYTCLANSSFGAPVKTTMKVKVKSKEEDGSKTLWVIILGVCVIFVLPLSTILYIKVRRERSLYKALMEAGITEFEKGDLNRLNPNLPVDDQAEFLPYHKKWEFPRNKLKFGVQLGSGAFGVVMKAEAQCIRPDEAFTTVAVKMVRRTAEITYIKALVSELKIMIHLGKHLNVVNLLGACTKNLTKRELLVIVEYCRFGNVHNYLQKHRTDFINQIDPKTDKLDFSIGIELLTKAKCASNSNKIKYATLLFPGDTNENSAGKRNSIETSAGTTNNIETSAGTTNSIETSTEEMNTIETAAGKTNSSETSAGEMNSNETSAGKTISIGSSAGKTNDIEPSEPEQSAAPQLSVSSENCHLSNNVVEPGWRSNYRGDYINENLKPICTQDLLCWAFQVARGMDYLRQRKILHGDLAARNILLADDNVVKICDFGLAKTLYKDHNYKTIGEGPLPVKWMALESLSDRVFSTQSDIWSFGIVLWEFFSLAMVPYPGMGAKEQYDKLMEGYRMPRPQYATQDLHEIMLRCWHAQPSMRPSFTDLGEEIGKLLEASVKNYYIDLNAPYSNKITTSMKNGEGDLLTMMLAPDHISMSSPCHENVRPPSVLSEGDSNIVNNEVIESGSIRIQCELEKLCSGGLSPSEITQVPSELDDSIKITLATKEEDPYLTPIDVKRRRNEFLRERKSQKKAEKEDEPMFYVNTQQP